MSLNPIPTLNRWTSKIGKTNLLLFVVLTIIMWWLNHNELPGYYIPR